jgi:hypothetical protein
MKHIFYRTFLAITVLGLSAGAVAEDAGIEGVGIKKVGVESLSTEVQALLKKEMVAVELAMKDIITANIEGDSAKIASIAKQIENSFILKQSLSKHQKHELHTKLSSDFIKQDQEFHYMAGMLAHAAEMDKQELINFYYSKLFEACSSCHKVHAQHRFPKFSNEIQTMTHEH